MKNFCQSFAAFSFAMMFFVGAASAYAAPCMTTEEDKGRVVETIRQMYAAAAKDDLDGFHRVTTAEFFAFDGGRRFDGDSLMNLIKTAHDAGKRYEWKVTAPEVHLTCNDAWIAYTNRGSLQDESGTKSLTWLESAFLRKEEGGWKIQFFHSTRVP
jgi:Domain of unknown function (DUF4440)